MADSLYSQLSEVDTILLGRVTYAAMANFWPHKAKDLSFPREDIAFADLMNSYRKIVFSKTLTTARWNNSRLVNGDPVTEICNLKKAPGKNMIIYGSGKIVGSLLDLRIIDEYQLWIHPILLGKGKPLFKGIQDKIPLRLSRTTSFSSGVVKLHYSNE